MNSNNKLSYYSKFKLNASNNQSMLRAEFGNDTDEKNNQIVLSNTNFRRGIIKTNDNYFYYLLNETQSNSYSQTYSAIKYEIDEESHQVNVTNDKLLIKYYPRKLLKEYFTDSKIIDFQFACSSKYKNLGKSHRKIQEIHEMIIRDDCILVVIEHFEYSLKDFLDLNLKICEDEGDDFMPARKEWFFTKLIYDIVSKFNEMTKIGIYFGGLINPNDISIRNLKVNLKDKYGPDKAMSNIEDVDFVLPNPFLYEIETIFLVLDNNNTSKTFPPEMLEKFSINIEKPNILETNPDVLFFSHFHKEEEKKKEGHHHHFVEKKRSSYFQNRLSFKNMNTNSEKKVNLDLNQVKKNQILFLNDEEEKMQFDSWMLGLLIYQILQNKLPENLTKMENIESLKKLYSNVDYSDKLFPGTNQNMESIFQEKKLKERKNIIGLEYIRTEISFVMKRIIQDAMRKNPKFRIYPNFDDCSDDMKFIESVNESNLTESFLSESRIGFNKAVDKIGFKNEKLSCFDEDRELQFLVVKKNFIKPFLEEYDPERFNEFHLTYFFTPSSINVERDRYLKLKMIKDLIPID